MLTKNRNKLLAIVRDVGQLSIALTVQALKRLINNFSFLDNHLENQKNYQISLFEYTKQTFRQLHVLSAFMEVNLTILSSSQLFCQGHVLILWTKKILKEYLKSTGFCKL